MLCLHSWSKLTCKAALVLVSESSTVGNSETRAEAPKLGSSLVSAAAFSFSRSPLTIINLRTKGACKPVSSFSCALCFLKWVLLDLHLDPCL